MTSFNNVELDGGMNPGGAGLELKKAKYPKKEEVTICYESNGGIHTHTQKKRGQPHSNKSLSIQTFAESDLEWW